MVKIETITLSKSFHTISSLLSHLKANHFQNSFSHSFFLYNRRLQALSFHLGVCGIPAAYGSMPCGLMIIGVSRTYFMSFLSGTTQMCCENAETGTTYTFQAGGQIARCFVKRHKWTSSLKSAVYSKALWSKSFYFCYRHSHESPKCFEKY